MADGHVHGYMAADTKYYRNTPKNAVYASRKKLDGISKLVPGTSLLINPATDIKN